MSTRFHDHDMDEPYPNAGALWERTCRNAIESRRGKAALEELRAALLAMPEKRLLRGELFEEGGVCAVGALAVHRAMQGRLGLATGPIAEWREAESVTYEAIGFQWAGGDGNGTAEFAETYLGVTRPWAFEVAYQNDEGALAHQTPEELYAAMLRWVERELARGKGAKR